MRTTKPITILTAAVAVLALSCALLTSSAAAHQHRPAATAHTSAHHQARRHHGRRLHRRYSARVASDLAPFHAPSLSAIAARTPAGNYSWPTVTGTTYYVSPSGSDSNSGTSPAHAWKTVHQVNKASVNFKPGDGVLFESGASFSDSTLMPGWGGALNGSRSAPIVFGSYGTGRASLPRGIWINGGSHLVLTDLDVGPKAGISGTGDHITVQACSIHDVVPAQVNPGQEEEAINAFGSYWVIRGNLINRTGDSGMLIRGDHFRIAGNVIDNTGLDPKITYGDHGIYLKATDSTATGNTIYNFHNDGISIRYRDSVVTNNTIADGEIGMAWFQYDPTAGTSQWTGNTITADTVAGMYVSGWDPTGGNTRESFVISGNKIATPTSQSSGWEAMNLKATTGTYTVSGNTIG